MSASGSSGPEGISDWPHGATTSPLWVAFRRVAAERHSKETRFTDGPGGVEHVALL